MSISSPCPAVSARDLALWLASERTPESQSVQTSTVRVDWLLARGPHVGVDSALAVRAACNSLTGVGLLTRHDQQRTTAAGGPRGQVSGGRTEAGRIPVARRPFTCSSPTPNSVGWDATEVVGCVSWCFKCRERDSNPHPKRGISSTPVR